ncbi:MAG: hypothetical protein WBA25_01625, partial [Jannaschia sp.]
DQSVLFEALRTELRATYGFEAGIGAYTRSIRFLVLTGEVETSRLAEAEEVVREAYGTFRSEGPDGALAARKAPLAQAIEARREEVGALAFGALNALLDGIEPGIALTLDDVLDAVTEEGLRDRLTTAYPVSDSFLVVAVSPDADALPDACVISEPEAADACP